MAPPGSRWSRSSWSWPTPAPAASGLTWPPGLGGFAFWLLAIQWVLATDPGAWVGWLAMAMALVALLGRVRVGDPDGPAPPRLADHGGRPRGLGRAGIRPGPRPDRLPLVLPGPHPVPPGLLDPDRRLRRVARPELPDRAGQRRDRRGREPPSSGRALRSARSGLAGWRAVAAGMLGSSWPAWRSALVAGTLGLRPVPGPLGRVPARPPRGDAPVGRVPGDRPRSGRRSRTCTRCTC